MIADLHLFDEEQDPDVHQSNKSDPDLHETESRIMAPHQSKKLDLGSHQGNVDPQHCFLLRIRILRYISRIRVLSLSKIEEKRETRLGPKLK